MSYYSGPTKEELFDLLVTKTRELGRLVTYDEMVAEPRMPVGANANSYSIHWGKFEKAAEEALSYVRRHDDVGNEVEPKGVMVLSKKGFKRLDPDREKTVMIELAELFVKEGGKLPPDRSIKKNRYIKAEEVEIVRRSGLFTEHKLEQYAVEYCNYTPKPKPVAASRPDPVVPIEPKNEPEVVTSSIATPVDGPEEEHEVENMEEKSRTAVRYTPEECEQLFVAECTKAGHILSRAEVEALTRQGLLPGWVTLTRQIGPWDEWSGRYGLKWKSKRIAELAKQAKLDREMLDELPDDSQNELEVVPEEMTENEEPAEAEFEAYEPDEDDYEGDESEGNESDGDESEGDDSEEYYEEDGESYENGIVIPIKIVLPEGVEGTVSDIHGSITITHLKIDF